MTVLTDPRFDFGNGRVTWYALTVDDTQTLGCHRSNLCEDMIQVLYAPNIILDVGWYGKTSGCFFVKLVKNSDWQNPLANIPALTVRGVIDVVNALVPAIPALTGEFVRHPRLDKLYYH